MSFRIVVCITSRNNGPVQVNRCLQSVLSQRYDNYRVFWRDDASNLDDDYKAAKELEKFHGSDMLFATRTTIRNYGLGNLLSMYDAAVAENETSIVMPIGGDDRLCDPDALAKTAAQFESGAWMTYCQYKDASTGQPGAIADYPDGSLEARQARNLPFVTLFPAYYAELALKVRSADLCLNGRQVDISQDTHLCWPILDMCGGKDRVRFIPDQLYEYSSRLQDPHYRENEYAYQCFMNWRSRHLPRYKRLKSLFAPAEVEPGDVSRYGLIMANNTAIFERQIRLRDDAGMEIAPDRK